MLLVFPLHSSKYIPGLHKTASSEVSASLYVNWCFDIVNIVNFALIQCFCSFCVSKGSVKFCFLFLPLCSGH